MRERTIFVAMLTLAAVALLSGCKGEEADEGEPTPTIVRPTATAAPSVDIREVDFSEVLEESGLDEWALGALRGGGIREEGIQYIDLTGDGLEEAIVLLDSGGSAGYIGLWVYGYVDEDLQALLARPDEYNVGARVEDSRLIVVQPVYGSDDPNCCPSQLNNIYYEWDGSELALVGEETIDNPHIVPPAPPVSPVSTPQAQTAVTTESGLYLVRPDGSGLRQLMSGQQHPLLFGWSPDGKRIATVTPCEDPTVLVAYSDSESKDELATLTGWAGGIAWAPDSQRLLVRVHREGPDDLAPADGPPWTDHVFLLDVGQPGQHRELFQGYVFAWSPDGASIAYAELVGINSSKVSVLHVADGALTTIADGLDWVGAIAWAPGGERFAYTTSNDVVVVNPEGGGPTVVASGRAGGLGMRLQWMPDGQQLAFTGPDGVALVSASGGPVQVLRTGSTFDVSSDGRFVAVYDYQGDETVEIFDMVAGGSRIVTGGLNPLGGVAFSPDGTQLLFAVQGKPMFTEDGQVYDYQRELHLVNVDGTGSRKLVQQTIKIVQEEWSPDGRFIVFNDNVPTFCP